jgi:hypothetical protein
VEASIDLAEAGGPVFTRMGSMLAPAFAQLPELEADTGAVRDLSIRWSAGGK